MKTFVSQTISSLLAWPLVALGLMLAVGDAHRDWWPAVPLMGYPTALVISFLLFGMITGGAATTIAYAKGK